jgi:N-carbamoyl-L-amino-acid hydrolase
VTWADLRVDGARLWQRIEALGEVGAVLGPNGERGCARPALTDADRAGRDLVVGWMRDLGLTISIDAIGNVVGTRPGTDPAAAAVMMGSHIDTVRTGGRFDGNLGVLGGLEVIETLEQHGVRTTHPISVSFFTDEEGARFAPDMLGSLVFVGGMAVEEALDMRAADDGARLGDELTRIGYAGSTPCPTASAPHAYFELHIEQGPVLEDEGVTIGAVTGVQGISWTELTITGQSAHAGTTPMRMRHDPGFVAAAITTGVRAIAVEMGGAQVATVGRLQLTPNLVNVVPASATMTIDLRNTDEAALRQAEDALATLCTRLEASEGVTIVRRVLARFEPVEFDAAKVMLVEDTARRLGHTTKRMPSGAGHDAQMLARVCPTAMVFVPSVNGLSHNIAEYTEPADITAGANVLLQVVLATAGVQA